MGYNIKKLGDDLHAKRRSDFTLESLSIEIGVSHTVLGEIEKGKVKDYSSRVLLKVIQFIGSKHEDYVE